MRRIILASASPRRKELLENAGVCFEICPAGSEEIITKTDPAEIVEELAEQKASEIAGRMDAPEDGTVIIGADTIVAYDGRILGKPVDEADALDMLTMLQGRTHQVYTGVTLLVYRDGAYTSRTFHECTDVTFYPAQERALKRYIATGEPMDKAGSYGIQGKGGIFVRGIRGDYQNVVGLPVARLFHEAGAMGIELAEAMS